jgi:hypothetical protein
MRIRPHTHRGRMPGALPGGILMTTGREWLQVRRLPQLRTLFLDLIRFSLNRVTPSTPPAFSASVLYLSTDLFANNEVVVTIGSTEGLLMPALGQACCESALASKPFQRLAWVCNVRIQLTHTIHAHTPYSGVASRPNQSIYTDITRQGSSTASS